MGAVVGLGSEDLGRPHPVDRVPSLGLSGEVAGHQTSPSLWPGAS